MAHEFDVIYSNATLHWVKDHRRLLRNVFKALRKAAFREYVVGEMIRETKQADGTCFETFRRINLFARK